MKKKKKKKKYKKKKRREKKITNERTKTDEAKKLRHAVAKGEGMKNK